MDKKVSANMDVDNRMKIVLKTVVDSYIENPVPVASKIVGEKSNLDVSPATIRNDMQALEQVGYLAHPHTSSGRIPTDLGYRFFVDNFVPSEKEKLRKTISKTVGIEKTLNQYARTSLDSLLEQTVVLLSTLTQHTAVVVKDLAQTEKICDVHVNLLQGNKFVFVVLFEDSSVRKVVVDSMEISLLDVSQGEIELLSDELNSSESFQSLFKNKTINEASAGIESDSEIPLELQIAKMVLGKILDENSAATDSKIVHVAGVANITKPQAQVDSKQLEISAQVLALIERHMILVELLQNNMNDSTFVRIGKENKYEELSQHSMVVAPIHSQKGTSGALGIIGPTRMDYTKVFACLDQASKAVSKLMDN